MAQAKLTFITELAHPMRNVRLTDLGLRMILTSLSRILRIRRVPPLWIVEKVNMFSREIRWDFSGNTVHYPDELGHKHPAHPNSIDATGQRRVFSGGRQSIVNTEDEASDEDETYDWSDEDDLVDEEARFEEKLGVKSPKKKKWGPKRIATFFFSTLIGSTILVGVLAAVPIFVHFYWYKPHPTPRRRWVSNNISAWFYWAAANLLISWYLAAIVNIVPHVMTWIVHISWGTVTERFKSNMAMYDAFKGHIKPILYAASGWVSWSIIFSGIFHLYDSKGGSSSQAAYTDRLHQVVVLIFFIVLLFSIEKIILQMIGFTFHRVAFEDRIQEVNKATNVLDHLKDYKPTHKNRQSGFNFGRVIFPPLRAPQSRPLTPIESQTEDPQALEAGFAADNDEIPASAKKYRKKQRSSKSWFGGGKRVPTSDPTNDAFTAEMTPISSGRDGVSNISSADVTRGSFQGERSRSNSPSPRFALGSGSQTHTYPPNNNDSNRRVGGGETEVTDDEGFGAVATTAARVLKTAVLHDARNIKGKDITAADLGFAISSPHEAKKLARNLYFAFRGDHRRRHLIPSDFYPAYGTHEAAKEAFKIFDKDGNGDITRAEIKTTILKIYKERRFLARSLRDVDHALSSLDIIMMVFFTMVLFFISLSVFSVSIGKSLASIYTLGLAASFVFKNSASNAFDAVIFLFVTHPFDTGDRCFIDEENLVVKKMGLFATTFTRADGTQVYYFNSQLFVKFISNVRRSEKMFENLRIQVNWRTPLEKLDQLDKCINHWIETDDNRWFGGGTNCTLQRIDNQRSLEITMGIPHNSNWQDWGAYLNRKTVFHAAVNHYCRELGITWVNSPQPVLLVNPDEKMAPRPSAYDEGNVTINEAEPPSPEVREIPVSPKLPPAPKPALFFKPPAEEYAAGMRLRKSRKNAARANHDF
ncbi:uncharacterized protein EI90DRAFT_3143512 [Cantharellus anzutake]|uniref:uncharacterized protein n=1 Tax=Cantharellus anzutake TaxID=1750568 RepID=UPI001905077C|nr:uncharacterized protein EI90DRAFT_3143512 [Cantharellus anzutake]KAF8343007.1 hypothetical protein EI90DRAFT_3143512 [Cantharellus anzutake]